MVTLNIRFIKSWTTKYLTNAIFYSISQVDYAVSLVEHMIKDNITCMDPTEKAQEKFSTELQSAFKGTTWASGCSSWYLSKKGEIQFLWPKTVTSFYFNLKKRNYETDYIKN